MMLRLDKGTVTGRLRSERGEPGLIAAMAITLIVVFYAWFMSVTLFETRHTEDPVDAVAELATLAYAELGRNQLNDADVLSDYVADPYNTTIEQYLREQAAKIPNVDRVVAVKCGLVARMDGRNPVWRPATTADTPQTRDDSVLCRVEVERNVWFGGMEAMGTFGRAAYVSGNNPIGSHGGGNA